MRNQHGKSDLIAIDITIPSSRKCDRETGKAEQAQEPVKIRRKRGMPVFKFHPSSPGFPGPEPDLEFAALRNGGYSCKPGNGAGGTSFHKGVGCIHSMRAYFSPLDRKTRAAMAWHCNVHPHRLLLSAVAGSQQSSSCGLEKVH